ncbi:MAG: M20 family metallopeptidase [Deltaproteobacteria bacterium]
MPFDLPQAARDLVRADTVSAKGNLAIVPVVARLCHATGLELRVFERELGGVRHANLLVSLPGGPAHDPLLFVTHTDTVAPGALERWTKTPPYEAHLEGDLLYGLGSADVKLDLAAKLLALERLRQRPALSRGVFLLGSYGEEIGLLGAKAFAKEGPVRPRQVVCGEPSELRVVHAHKGYLVAHVWLGRPAPRGEPTRTRQITGRACHSSTPTLGENAIEKALGEELAGAVSLVGGQGANSVPGACEVSFHEGPTEIPLDPIRAVARAWRERIGALVPARDERFSPAETVSNLGLCRAAGGEAELLFDARLLPGHDPAAVAALFERDVRAAGGRLALERENPAVWTDPSGELCRAACAVSARLGLAVRPETKATNTEAAAFAGMAEAIVFGPGPSRGNAHCPNEHTHLSEVVRAVDWYEALALELCR